MGVKFTASMMCADYGNLEKEVRELESAGIDSFHIDIMDGRYVPNFAMSLNDMKYIASATNKPLDVHLMIEHPCNHIDVFLCSNLLLLYANLYPRLLTHVSSPHVRPCALSKSSASFAVSFPVLPTRQSSVELLRLHRSPRVSMSHIFRQFFRRADSP